jgi:dTDP-4-dehydrorhamnose 3,5-epimerase-like enzyme
MRNFNKTKIDGEYMIEPKVFGDKKGDEYAIK